MLLDTDQDITRETIQYSQEYAVAKQIHKLIGNERFKIYDTYDYGSEFGISIEYDVYHYGHQASYINRFIECVLHQVKLPDPLYVKYDYTAFDWTNPTSTNLEIKRSGYNVEIMDPEHVDHVIWDGAMFSSHDFYLKFSILGERIPNCSNMYDGMFKLRIQKCESSSARKIVDLLKGMLKESPII